MGDDDWKEFFDLVSEDVTDSKVWTCAVDNEDLKVWKRPDAKAPINLVRLWAKIPGTKASTLYEMLTPVDEIGYYSAKAPSPISNRDFCTHRTFRAFEDKYVIFNKSVEHPKVPKNPDFVRGWSFRTGYQMKDVDD